MSELKMQKLECNERDSSSLRAAAGQHEEYKTGGRDRVIAREKEKNTRMDRRRQCGCARK